MKTFTRIAAFTGVMFMLSGCIIHDGYRGHHYGGGHHYGHDHHRGG